jgi:hypothetical protein
VQVIVHTDRHRQKPLRPATGTARRVIFVPIPLLVLAAAATFVLSALEKREVIVTERLDDSVSHAPVQLLEKINTDVGETYRLGATNIDAATLPVRKTPDVPRLLISGESFARALTRWTRATLDARCPTRQFEIINGGAGGRTPDAVVGITEELLAIEPDVLVVAMGNNQGLHTGAKINDVLHQWVVYRLLKRVVLPEPGLNERPYLMVQDRDADAARMSFENSLRSIVQAARTRQARTVLCTMPVNLRYSDPRVVPNDPLLQQGRELLAQGRFREAIETLSNSPQQAWAAKFIGDCLFASGEYGHAKTVYRISVEMNPLGRTRPTLNETVRQVCREEKLPLVDLERTLEKLSPNGIPDPAIFTDNCHLTPRGYSLMAREIVRVLIRQGLLGEGHDDTPPPDWESELDAAAGP